MVARKLDSVNLRAVDAVAPSPEPLVQDAVECGPIWLSPHEMCELRVRGHRVPMSETQLTILAELIRAQGRIVTRDELLGEPAGTAESPKRAVDIQVSRIRVALGPLGRHLIAVRGRGYRVDVRGLSQAR